MLAKQLGAIDPRLLEINLALLDPVPGNLITTSTLDLFDISLAKKTMDLRACKPLKNVLTLYPHEPLPTLAVHAPLFSLYPKHTKVEEDVIAGCHAAAQFQDVFDDRILFYKRASFITFARIFQFLKDCGSQFKPFPALKVREEAFRSGEFEVYQLTADINALDQALLSVYGAENAVPHAKTYRDCHSATGISINTKDQASFFNLHHQRLAGVAEDKNSALVTIEENQGPISQIKRAILHYPKTWQAIKWSFLSIGLAGLLFFTGGLGAIPMISAIVAKLGIVSILAAAPVAGAALGGLWYGAFKPLSQWAINRFFYPKFHIRDIHPIDESITGSPQVLVTGLGVKQKSNALTPSPTETIKHSKVFTKQPGVVTIPTIIVENEDKDDPLLDCGHF